MNELLKKGSLRLQRAHNTIPVMNKIDEISSKEKPLEGLKTITR